MQEAFRRGAFEGVMRNYRGELAECTTVEPLHRQERRGADAAARRGPAGRHHARVPVRDRRARSASRCASRCCTTTICSAPTKRSSPARRARSCRSSRVDDRTIGTGTPGPVTRALLDAFREARVTAAVERRVDGRAFRLGTLTRGPETGPLDGSRESSRRSTFSHVVRLDRRAGADQVAIAVRVVDAPDARPELVARGRTAAETPPARASTDASTRRPSPPPPCAARSSARCPSDRPCRR